MLRKTVYCLCGVVVAVTLIAQSSSTEAPAGFDTPANRLNPGSGSTSNGIVEPNGDTFANDQAFFEKQEDASDGIGPVFNAASCVTCHANPVTGGASQITELRVGHLDATAILSILRYHQRRRKYDHRPVVNQRPRAVPGSAGARASD
jgi:CxxC motif-containing protein (DUF1111 family)